MNTSKNEKTVNDDRQIEENNEHKCLQPSNNIKVMETSFSKLNLDEKNKEINKTSLLVKPKPNDRWPQILLHQLNFYFSPPTCLTITKLEEELNLLFKQFFLCIKIQTERKEQVLLENPHLLPKLDGLQTTSLSQLIVQYMWEIYRRKDNQLEFLLPIIAFIEWARNSTFDCTASMQIMLCRLYDWNKLSDNRDFSVFPSIIPDNLIKQIAEYSFNQMKHFFMFKNALLTAIGSIGSCLLEDRIANLELVIVQCRSLLDKDFELINNSTLISSLRARVIQPISGSIKRIKLFLTKNVDINRMSQDENFNKKLNEVMEIIPESIRQPINKLMTEQILKWLNDNINCSVNEMNQTCDFLLAKFC
ncbi:hypothetical protein Mgra_00006598 [Meloidogyne graminicola]|uniref:Uncharacterized protein n=1 Tax=Meloidogyne graminicola TaxID=189291 RepID=A0A8S9ZL59_9BILA|nr:hypothetical protein Mgra_00006598 [Meloidogyne graminicola]